MRSYGQLAYEAYCESTGWRSVATQEPLPTWQDLLPAAQSAWESAAQAVVDRLQPQE